MIAVDLFCGAGGTSTGLVQACSAMGLDLELMAINHWDIAIQTHSSNHPNARHMCASLDSLNPRELFKEDELDMLWASPECTHHSIARGGKPINDQSRATAWCVVRWADALRPKVIMVENVPEFLTWGAIDSKGKPMKSKKGATFMAWVEALKSLGYRVEWKTFIAADYGDPTTRKRLFVQAVRGRRKITWPEPTHAKPSDIPHFLKELKPWRGAREIIDWDLPSKSIFTRERPLSPKTLDRIFAGLRKYGINPYVVSWDHKSGVGHSPSEAPLTTVTTKARHGVVEPFLVQVAHGDSGGRRSRSLVEPLATVRGGNEWALAEPMLLPQQSCGSLRPVSEPMPTVSTAGAIALIEPFILPYRGERKGQKPRSHSITDPMPTVTAGATGHGLVEPFLVSYYGNGEALSLQDPMDTITTKDRFGLVQPTVIVDGEKYLLDIHFRMLQPHELAGAQGFPKDYKFCGGKTNAVKQIGNAVPVNLAAALCTAVLQQSRTYDPVRSEAAA